MVLIDFYFRPKHIQYQPIFHGLSRGLKNHHPCYNKRGGPIQWLHTTFDITIGSTHYSDTSSIATKPPLTMPQRHQACTLYWVLRSNSMCILEAPFHCPNKREETHDGGLVMLLLLQTTLSSIFPQMLIKQKSST
jgi:hypothetical protein